MKLPNFQKGYTHLLLLFAVFGLIVFIFIASSASFKDKVFSFLFPKPPSHAAENPSSWTSPTVFAHYYAWYGGSPLYKHWSTKGRIPPNDIDPKFYPTLSVYDGAADAVIDWHMKWLKFAKVDVALLSYWGANHEFSTDATVKKILDKAAENGLKVAFTLEPGPVEKHKESITHIINNLTNNGTHPGLYKVVRQTKYGTNTNPRPLFLFYNWGQHYGNNNPDMTADQIKTLYREMFDSLRNTPLDGIFLTDNSNDAMVLNPLKNPEDTSSRSDLDNFHSDGTFAYDADAIWTGKTFAKSNDYVNMIQVSPGFDNTKIGGSKVIDRRNGAYYDDSWKEVAAQKPEWVSILSFNEWGENSQIEPAHETTIPGFSYLNYKGYFPTLTCVNDDARYLCSTASWVDKYKTQLSPQPSTSPTPTPSVTASPSPTSNPTPTPVATPTRTPTPSPTPSSTSTATPRPIPSTTAFPTVHPTSKSESNSSSTNLTPNPTNNSKTAGYTQPVFVAKNDNEVKYESPTPSASPVEDLATCDIFCRIDNFFKWVNKSLDLRVQGILERVGIIPKNSEQLKTL